VLQIEFFQCGVNLAFERNRGESVLLLSLSVVELFTTVSDTPQIGTASENTSNYQHLILKTSYTNFVTQMNTSATKSYTFPQVTKNIPNTHN